VLVISMGCGNTASAFAAFPIERLDVVDISSGPFEAAKLFATTRTVLEDPRVHVTVEDGRNFLLKTPRKYDVIELELPSLHTDGVAFLYTREFYEIARSRLTEGGVISQWIDAFQTRRQPSHRLVATMREVFPEVSVWANRWSWWILGVNGGPPGAPDYERVRALFESASVREDMARVGTDLEDVLASLVGYGDALDEALGSAPPITDDHTWIDFELPKLPTPASLGGGVAYYNAPLRRLFEAQWQRGGGIRQDGLVPFHGGGPERHAELVDRSLRAFAPGYPPELLERVAARNGAW
jgi:spermidine synthase